MVQQLVAESRHDFQDLRDLFKRLSTEGSDVLTLTQFASQLRDDEVKVIFARPGVDVTDAEAFFRVLGCGQQPGLGD